MKHNSKLKTEPSKVLPASHIYRPAVRYFFFVSATQSATSATFKLQQIHLIN